MQPPGRSFGTQTDRSASDGAEAVAGHRSYGADYDAGDGAHGNSSPSGASAAHVLPAKVVCQSFSLTVRSPDMGQTFDGKN